jgi:AraC family transcriptional regulator of adaptative response/methylated-DNA-[protein]-cysteine methyltransferase
MTLTTKRFAQPEARWRAVLDRDSRADGQFWFSVATTGVYCYPSCAARRPRRANVAFHDTAAAAAGAGFRPCKRCRPDLPPRHVRRAQAVSAACRAIETAERAPTLTELAIDAGLSPHHFHRVFKQIAGVTPKQYAIAHRAERARQGLSAGKSVTDSIYDAGFASASRFYASAPDDLGMKPRTFAKGGAGEHIRWEVAKSILGPTLVAATERGVCAILFGASRSAVHAELSERFPRAQLERAESNSEFSGWVTRAIALIENPHGAAELPIDVAGTAFQRRVWSALRQVPAGTTTTYADIAKRIGQPTAARAVAGACAANPVAVAIPCHRVLASDGSLSGYRWGKQRKQALLDRESER